MLGVVAKLQCNMTEIKYNLLLSQREIDVVLDSLSQKPFREVHQIISTILEQFRAQSAIKPLEELVPHPE